MVELTQWFQFGRYNLALITGQISRILCLDIDYRHDGLKSIAGKEIPNTWHEKSPNGEHYFFKWTPALNALTTSHSDLLPGVDTRGNGGYVIISPSVGYNGEKYQWVNHPMKAPLAYPPSWLVDLFRTSRTLGITNKQGWIAEALAGLAEGNRDNTFIKIAGRLWSDGWQAGDILEVLKPHAEQAAFPLEDLKLKVEQIQKYPRNEVIDLGNETDTNIEAFMSSTEDNLQWNVEGLVPEQSVTILGGMQGLGKTWLMLDLAIELSRGGGSWLNKYQVNQGNVLYVDEESSNRLLRYRLRKLISAKGLKIGNLKLHLTVGRNLDFCNENSVSKFRTLIEKTQPKVIFIDSLIRVHKVNENSSNEMAQVFNVVKKLAREFNCTFFFADHENKGVYNQETEKEPSSNDLRGSNEKGAFADSILSLRKKNGELYMYHTKSRHCEAGLPIMVKIEDMDEAKTKLCVRGY